MSAPQAQNLKQQRTRLRLRSRRDALHMSLADLAKIVGHDPAVVSKAINHGRYPRVVEKIKEALGA